MSDEGLAEFFDARDLFLGVGNGQGRQDLAEGFRRLKGSAHIEARYVCSLFPSGCPETMGDARRVFLVQGQHPIALCYAGFMSDFSLALLRRAALLGHPLALGWLSRWTEGAERFEMAERAAEAGDRVGWCALGLLSLRGSGCQKDLARARDAFRESMRLGSADAMRCYGQEMCSKDDPERYRWLGGAGRADGGWRLFMMAAVEQLRLHDKGQGRGAVLVMIGRTLRGHERQVAEEHRLDAAKAVWLYERCVSRAREAVLCWMMCAKRLALYRDVSTMVGRRVWEEREAFFEKK